MRRDIEYTRVGDQRLAMDAAIPRTAAPVPAVIVVHGGGWVRGDRATDVAPILGPLSDAGFAWFSISYRLMNDNTTQSIPTASRWSENRRADSSPPGPRSAARRTSASRASSRCTLPPIS